MAPKPPAKTEQDKKRWYISRLFIEAKEDLSLEDAFIDLVVVLVMTAILLLFKVAESSEKRELYYSAILYFALSIIAVIAWKVFYKTPRKIIRDLDEKLEKEIERNAPKFKLSCPKGEPSCSVPSLDNSCLFLRICVETDCPEGIKNCYGRLLKIEKDGHPVFNCDTRPLPFAQAEDADSMTKTIPKGVKYNLDVLCIGKAVHVVMVAGKPPVPLLDQNRDYPFNESGDYILDVAVCGDAPTEKIKLKFTWGMQWDSARIEEIK